MGYGFIFKDSLVTFVCITGIEKVSLWILQPCPISNVPVPFNICLGFGIVLFKQFKLMSIELLIA